MIGTRKLPPYMLQELPDITESIKYPVRNVQRIKYTCFDVSKNYIAFGATSGGIYVFNRSPCEFVQLIPNKDGPITKLAISTNEKYVAFANGHGIVTVTICKQSLSGGHSSVTSKEHHGNEVTTMAWSSNILFTGDDTGKIAVLQLQTFIAMLQSSSQTIMNLDSRICQLDVKDCMLLVSTLSRCYICDTLQEQYRQIGQKLRDGEFGACFVTKEKTLENGSNTPVKDYTEAKKYNIVHDEEKFAVGKSLENVLIYSARPSSRLWEASIDGTVRRTHQFKQVLAKDSMKLMSIELYNNEMYEFENSTNENEGKSVNFSKIFNMNGAIFSFKRDALYFLDIQDEMNTVWYDSYKNIVDAKIYQDNLYLWLTNGSLVSLKFMKIEKFLIKCYIDEKYGLCAELCALFYDYFLNNILPAQLHIVVGVKEKIKNNDLLKKIEPVLLKFESMKATDALQTKSGIYVLDNTFKAQSSLDDETDKNVEDNRFGTLPPEALQTLKDLSVSVTDKLSSSKKILKEKWGDFEDKMKLLNIEKPQDNKVQGVIPKRIPYNETLENKVPTEYEDTEIIYKESSQKAIIVQNNCLEDEVCKSLYQYFRLSLVGKETDKSNLISIIENYACDISKIYHVMLLLEKYCISVGAFEESKFVPNSIFLNYLSLSNEKDSMLESIINDEELYKYFVDSCISVNVKTRNLTDLGCECGFPLPYNRTNQVPVFSHLIDEFIEKQWSSQSRDQCYEICKKMPYLWRKMLYLRRNEDLVNLLQILLQILDEKLLNSFLPQFTLVTWERAIQLYAILHANICLNCNRSFDHISVKETLSWDDIGAMVIKSIGGSSAIKVMEKHASLLNPGDITMKFYHTCLLVTMFEKIDVTITKQLTDAIYSCYDFANAREQIFGLLRSNLQGAVKNTSLPITVAAKTIHWGLHPLTDKRIIRTDNEGPDKVTDIIRDVSLTEIIGNLSSITKGETDCVLCGLPLSNEVLLNDGGLWVFKCGHTFHGACLDMNKVKLCPGCMLKAG